MSPEELKKMIKERDIEVERQLSFLKRLVKKYPLDEFLMVIGALNWPGNNASNYLDSIIGNKKERWLLFQIYIPALAKFAILNSNDYIGIHNKPFDEAFRDIEQALVLINEIKDQIPFEFADDFNLVVSSFHFFIANQHYRFQTTLSVAKNIIARSFVLFRNLPAEMFPSLNLSSIFQDIYGLNQNKFFIISARLLGLKQKDWFDFSKFSGLENMGNNLTIDDLKIFFDKLSLSYAEFRKESNDNEKSFTGKSSQFYGYSPFDKYPILSHKQKYIIISQHYLIWRTYLPIYFDFLEFFTEKENKLNNSFSNSFGKIFQEYVGLMLSQLKDSSKLIDEIKYGKSKKDFVDWSLLYPEKNSAILFEVKKHIIPLKAKFSMDKMTLEKNLTNTIVKGFIQINNKIKSIHKNEKGLESFKTSYSYYPVVITFDDSYCLNDFFIRKIINDKLKELQIEFELEWQIITIRELEQIIYTCNEDNSFLDLLKNKINNNNIFLEWDKYLVDSGIKIEDNEHLRSIIRNELI